MQKILTHSRGIDKRNISNRALHRPCIIFQSSAVVPKCNEVYKLEARNATEIPRHWLDRSMSNRWQRKNRYKRHPDKSRLKAGIQPHAEYYLFPYITFAYIIIVMTFTIFFRSLNTNWIAHQWLFFFVSLSSPMLSALLALQSSLFELSLCWWHKMHSYEINWNRIANRYNNKSEC